MIRTATVRPPNKFDRLFPKEKREYRKPPPRLYIGKRGKTTPAAK